MDFARRQLEKYGWSDGKGLGKHENGISQALKPKLKRSATGIGHDAAAEFTEHWWKTLYDKAASNVEVHDSKGKTKKIKTKDQNDFEITNSTWKLNKRNKCKDSEEQYVDYFVKTAVLTNGGSKTEKVREDSDTEEEGEKNRDLLKMTDEELFAACEGRTAHKGARHGLKALGKLARIEQQEQILLQQLKYQVYSKKNKTNENEDKDTNLIPESDLPIKKKKKRKRCNSNDNLMNPENIDKAECEIPFSKASKKKPKKNITADHEECDFDQLTKSEEDKDIEKTELDLNKRSKRKNKKKKDK